MNENLKKIAIEAQVEHCISHVRLQAFADLIVKRCANIVWDEAEKTANSDVNDAGYKIIEYFHGDDK